MVDMLEAAGLTRRFGARVAVDDVSISLHGGEVFGLLGPNGAGKTTTLRMLAGLIAPSAGEVRLDGQPVAAADARLRRAIGFLTEQPGLWERLSVGTNLLTYARLYDLPAPHEAVRRVLDRLQIADRAGDAAGTLSKGLKQRVALARALLHDPRIVLLDEPTAGLDPESARGVRDLVGDLRAAGRVIVFSSHNLDEVERIADRIAVLDQRLIAQDTPANLRARLFGHRLRVRVEGDAQRFAALLERLGAPGTAAGDTLTVALGDPDVETPRLVRALVEAGAAIREVTPAPASLEDVYLRLVRRGADGAGEMT